LLKSLFEGGGHLRVHQADLLGPSRLTDLFLEHGQVEERRPSEVDADQLAQPPTILVGCGEFLVERRSSIGGDD
jgi:hypothetical protein